MKKYYFAYMQDGKRLQIDETHITDTSKHKEIVKDWKSLGTDLCILTDKDLPKNVDGVWQGKIENGKLIKIDANEALSNVKTQQHTYACIDIDSETSDMISRGFEFDNHVFSLSKSAQLNWNRILSMFSLGLLSSKTEISTKNNDVYILTSEQVKPFAEAYHNAIESVLKHSRKQKLNIG